MFNEYSSPVIISESVESFNEGIIPFAVCWGMSTSQGNVQSQAKCS